MDIEGSLKIISSGNIFVKSIQTFSELRYLQQSLKKGRKPSKVKITRYSAQIFC